MAVSQAETIGFADQFRQFLIDNQAELLAKGLDVSSWITTIEAQRNDALLQLGKQDEIEAAARAQTKVVKASVELLYDTTSTQLDAAIGIIGKKTEAAKQAARLRSSIHKQYKKKKNEDDES